MKIKVFGLRLIKQNLKCFLKKYKRKKENEMNRIELINKILLLYNYLENNEDENAELEYFECIDTLKEEYNLTLDEIL